MFLYSTVSTLKPVITTREIAKLARYSLLTDRRDGRDDLSQLQLVQDGGLTGSIQSNLVATVSSVFRYPRVLFTINIPGQKQWRVSICIACVIIDFNYLRISFLPKRPERRRETERPMAAKVE